MDMQFRRPPDVAQPFGYLDAKPERNRVPGWLKISALILIIVILLAVSMMLLGGGHNPMQHF
jgi:hypothetical protein